MDPKNLNHQTILSSEGTHIAHNRLRGKTPGVVFLGGFMSDMQGTKAAYVESVCQSLGVSYVRFDYFGHGKSSGQLKEGSISRWKNDALFVLDTLTEGPQILVGSSMGGWLSVLISLERPQRIQALVGIAAAPDFVKDFSRLTEQQLKTLEKEGICYLPSHYGDPYPITRHLLEDGLQQCVLGKPIAIECPVRLLHGMDDEQVHWQQSVKLAEDLISDDVVVTLIKKGDHRLSEPHQLEILKQTLCDLVTF